MDGFHDRSIAIQLSDMNPLITIAVTTFNRKEMLKQCLASILHQEFSDYEVLVGNNFTEEVLTLESLEISDPRVNIVNHQSNLGQLGNMNYLLAEAKGRYFTWLADDDMLTPECLVAISAALEQHAYPKCVFSSYIDAPEYIPGTPESSDHLSRQIYGPEFVQQYLSRKLKLIGCYGGFETSYLREVGGIRKLGTRFSPYADNLIAIEAGLLDRVVYVDAPLFFFRTHDQSLSFTSSDLAAYASAQAQLLSICEDIFVNTRLVKDYHRNLYRLLAWFVGDIYSVCGRSRSLWSAGMIDHLRVLERYARRTGWFYPRFIALNFWLVANSVRNRVFQKRGKA